VPILSQDYLQSSKACSVPLAVSSFSRRGQSIASTAHRSRRGNATSPIERTDVDDVGPQIEELSKSEEVAVWTVKISGVHWRWWREC
jgi:hypothetical protein